MRNPVRIIAIAVAAFILLLIVGRAAAIFYTDALWYRALDQSPVFWTRITAYVVVRVLATLFAAALILVNLWFVLRQLGPVHLRRRYGNLEIAEQVPRKLLTLGAIAVALLAGWWLSSVQFGGNVPIAVLAWLRHVSWGVAEPVFGRDISFYMFALPMYARLLEYVLIVVLWAALLITVGYVIVGAVRVRGTRWDIDERPRTHFAVLLACAFVVLGARVFLSRYQIVLQGTGIGDALGYTDVHARLPARLVIAILLVVTGMALLYGVLKRLWAPPLLALGVLVLVTLGMGVAYPQIVQKFTVVPNQLGREAQYIGWNLQFTRAAYGLDNVERRQLPYRRADAAVWTALAPTLDRLPLWDTAPLQTALNEVEAGYRYYQFPDVDYDRYRDGTFMRQVAIGVREFTPDGLSEGARTWQNLHMNPVYTRGIGAIVAPAAQKQGGDPVYWLRDIQPVQRSAAAPERLELTSPSVYFGETMAEYAIVGSGGTFARELPPGTAAADVPVVTTGIPLGSFARVLAFASRFGEPNLLFTGDLSDATRLIFRRDVAQRVNALAPFLVWDPDALPVIVDGRILWLLDGYTASANYPLARATPIAGLGSVRYLRGSVKATVDAVTGEVRMYAIADADPIVRTYRAIFPGLIADLSAMPAVVQEHLRYPPLLFQVQANILDEYHIDEPQAFFSGEDVWQLPQEVAAQERRRPAYMLAALPGSSEPEFLLMQPFIARQRQNMTALLVARSDAPHYGDLVLFAFPRDDQVKGPAQVQTIIEQDPLISQQLSLWRQRGTTVDMGQLRILATDSSVVYVRPLFLSAQDGGIPQLQRVVVSDGIAVAMAEDLPAAIAGLGAEFVRRVDAAPPPSSTVPSAQLDPALMRRALELMRQADERLRAGDFAGFGAAWNELRALLERAETGGGP